MQPTAFEVELVVEAYHETDISKVKHVQKVHSYATFALRNPHSPLRNHAPDGKLKLNMPRSELVKAGPLPLTVGTRLRAAVVPGSESYVEMRSFEVLP